MKIRYRDAFRAWQDFDSLIDSMVIGQHGLAIAEIGAGANPMLSHEIVDGGGFKYHLIDESAGELDKADNRYERLVIDMTIPLKNPQPIYDLLIARMTLEHIADPVVFFANAKALLKPGGKFLLFYACPTNMPLFVNKLLPEKWSDKLLKRIQPFRQHEKHGKFRAFYRWCYGPTKKNMDRFLSTGLHLERYTGFFGHSYYQRFRLLDSLEKWKTAYLLNHPTPRLCTYAQVVLGKSLKHDRVETAQG